MEKISVCIATYNGEKYIRQQLQSIVSQLSEGDEVIISDDGSNDETLKIISGVSGPIRVVGTQNTGSIVKNFERALQNARNEIIILSDQDDVWLPDRISVIRREIVGHDLIMTDAKVVDSELRILSESLFADLNTGTGFFRNFVKNGYVGCCLAFRKSVLDLALPFRHDLPWHDWFIALIAEINGQVKLVREPTILYRRHGNNASETTLGSSNTTFRKISLRWRLLRALAPVMWKKLLNGRV